MSIFSENIKVLRKVKGLSQDALAGILGVKRTTLSNYENALSSPSLEAIGDIADAFHVDIDTLLRCDLSQKSAEEIESITSGECDTRGRNLRVIVTTVSPSNEENVEIVPVKARAGYTAGYADPEYISSLPHISLPFLSSQRKYRAFPITGDSMPPVPSGSYVVGEYVVDWHGIKDGEYAIVVTKDEGIVFKRVYMDFERGVVQLVSTSPLYEPYVVSMEDILEIWTFSCYISREITSSVSGMEQMCEMLSRMQKDISFLKTR